MAPPIIFPDNPPLASPIDDLKDEAPKVARAGVTAISLYQPAAQVLQPYPVVQAGQAPQPEDDPEKENTVPQPYRVMAVGALGSTSTDVPFFANNSTDAAGQVVRQRRQWIEQTHRAINAMPSTNLALHNSSRDVPFVQTDWPVPSRRPSTAHLTTASTNAALLFGNTSSTGLP